MRQRRNDRSAPPDVRAFRRSGAEIIVFGNLQRHRGNSPMDQDYAMLSGETTMAKLLLIEDDRETADEIIAELVDRGFEVDWAATGIEGLDKARSGDPDAKMADRRLPRLVGLTIGE